MEIENKDQPAYPQACTSDGYGANVYGGLTKREYFAAMAMQGIISRSIVPQQLHNWEGGITMAVKWADELIKQLEIK